MAASTFIATPPRAIYLRLLMDSIFGADNYKAEITWRRTFAHNDSRTFGNVTDKILFYGQKSINADDVRTPLRASYVKSHYRFTDDRGVYQDDSLTGPRPFGGRERKDLAKLRPRRYWALLVGAPNRKICDLD